MLVWQRLVVVHSPDPLFDPLETGTGGQLELNWSTNVVMPGRSRPTARWCWRWTRTRATARRPKSTTWNTCRPSSRWTRAGAATSKCSWRRRWAPARWSSAADPTTTTAATDSPSGPSWPPTPGAKILADVGLSRSVSRSSGHARGIWLVASIRFLWTYFLRTQSQRGNLKYDYGTHHVIRELISTLENDKKQQEAHWFHPFRRKLASFM